MYIEAQTYYKHKILQAQIMTIQTELSNEATKWKQKDKLEESTLVISYLTYISDKFTMVVNQEKGKFPMEVYNLFHFSTWLCRIC